MPGHLPRKSVPPVHTCRKVSARQMPVPASYLPAAFLFAIRPVTVSVPAGLSVVLLSWKRCLSVLRHPSLFGFLFPFPGLPAGWHAAAAPVYARGTAQTKEQAPAQGKEKVPQVSFGPDKHAPFSMHGLPVTYTRHRCAASGRYYPLFQYAHMPSRSVPETRNGRSAVLPVPWYISSLPYKCLQLPHHIKLPKQPTHAPYKKGQTPHILPAPWRWFHLRQFLCFHSAGTFLRSVFFCCNGFPATEMLFHPCCFPPACFLPYPAIGLIRRIAIRRKTNASATNKSVETAIHP